ncbi:hypothetical protein [Myxosarcina sp. GI1]|uniref:hypothetical protein n=1 Tax=Myxosarcina sp. GI1 TaxID=1541065 RepID=UPI000569EC83|nr:hypothetical protein [Myxosarcina sp. GI1]
MNQKFALSEFSRVTLVVFYGSSAASKLIELSIEIQKYIANLKELQGKFVPYQTEQIHGTIVGCEGLKTSLGIINKWFYFYREQIKYIDFNWIEYLQTSSIFPIKLRFCGYDPKLDYGFLSRGLHPAIRSFQLQSLGEETVPVLIGWAFKSDRITWELDSLRRNAQKFNLLHKYFSTPQAIDNDFYLRLGTIKGKLPQESLDAIAQKIREFLTNKPPLYIALDRTDLAFASYQDISLTPATTQIFPLLSTNISQIEQLY